MPVTIEIDMKAGVVICRTSGRLSGRDIISTLGEVFVHPDFQPGMSEVWDMRSGAIDALSQADVQAIVAFVTARLESRGCGRLAIVASEDLTHGVARVVDGWAVDLPFEREIFRDFDEAVRWASGASLENGEDG